MGVRPAAGETVRETKLTEILPAGESGERVRLPDLWDMVETLSVTTDPSNPDYQFTLYRGTKSQKAEDKEWLGKFHERMNREKIQSMFGGGAFNIWLKLRVGKGNALELKYNEDLKIGGTPIAASSAPGSSSTSAGVASADPMNQIIGMFREELRALRDELKTARGGDLGIEAVRQALTLNGQVFSSAAQSAVGTLSRISGNENSVPARDPLIERLLAAAIDRMVAPPATNSIKDTIEMIAAIKGAGLMGGGGSDKTGIALELVRQIPNVATTLVQGIQAWQMGVEAQARHAAMIRGAQPPIQVVPQPQPAAQPPNVIPISAPAGNPGEPAAAQPAPQVQIEVPNLSIEQVEGMLCNIIMDTNLSLEDAATEACALIERSMPGMTDQMISRGEEFLINLFHTRPVLQQVANHPRLPAFVKTFIAVVKAAPVIQAPNPAAPVA